MQAAHILFLEKYFTQLPGGHLLSSGDLFKITSCFECQLYFNKENYLRQGEVCQQLGIVHTGLLKVITVDNKKNRIFKDVICPDYNPLLVDWESYIYKQAAEVSFISKGETIVLTLSLSNFEKLCTQVPNFSIIARALFIQPLQARKNLMDKIEDLGKEQKRMVVNYFYPIISDKITLDELAAFVGLSRNAYSK